MVWETRTSSENEDEQLADKLTRRESAEQRKARIARKQLDPATVAAFAALYKESK